jgi:hypothetical protein
MIAERGVSLAHTTIMRWIVRYVPEFEKRWNRFACRAGASWRVEKIPYAKIKDRWAYLYRAVDKQGKTVDSVFGPLGGETGLYRLYQQPPEQRPQKKFLWAEKRSQKH